MVILRYAGGGNWTQIGSDPNTDQVQPGGNTVYQEHVDGSVWQYNGAGNWVELDTNPNTVIITPGLNGKLYQKHRDGSLWQYDGRALYSWSELDANPNTVGTSYPASHT